MIVGILHDGVDIVHYLELCMYTIYNLDTFLAVDAKTISLVKHGETLSQEQTGLHAE